MSAMLQMDDYKKLPGELSLDDLYGLSYEKMILRALYPFEGMDEVLLLPNTRLLLFAGPDGYGKHTLAHAFAGELSALDYEFFVVDGELLAEEENAADVLGELFGQMLMATNPMDRNGNLIEHRKCYLVLEHLDKLCEDKKACIILARMFALLNADDPDYYFNDLVIAGTAVNLGDIPDSIRMHMQILELQLPEEKERREYFLDALTLEIEEEGKTYSFMPIVAGVPEIYLGELTKGFTYADMRKVVMLIKMCFKQTISTQYNGDFAKAAKDIKSAKNFLNQDYVEMIIDRIKNEKKAAQKKKEVLMQGQAPQIVYVNGGGSMQFAQTNGVNMASVSKGAEPKNNYNEDVVDITRFEFLRNKSQNEQDLSFVSSDVLENM